MPLRKQQVPKVADAIVAELEQMIVDGTLQPGQKLLPERELAVQFQVSRPSLREAIQRLEAKGLLYRRQGGGTYVQQELSRGLTDPLFELLLNNPGSQFDLLEFRHVLEGVAAYYAALRGTEADFDRSRAAQASIEATQLSGDLSGEAVAVTEFYLVMMAASHNTVLLHLVRAMRTLLERNIQRNIQHSVDMLLVMRAVLHAGKHILFNFAVLCVCQIVHLAPVYVYFMCGSSCLTLFLSSRPPVIASIR